MDRRTLLILIVAATVPLAAPAAPVSIPKPAAGEAAADPARLESLVEELGSDEYWVREAAAAELRALGTPAIDALIAAAESTGDLEIALSARWLVDAIPIVSPADPPEVAELVERLGQGGIHEAMPVLQRLVRLDDDDGIEPLARVARVDRSPSVSLAAAALLAGELSPAEPSFARVSQGISRGFGTSRRPAVEFVRGMIEWSNGGGEGLDRAAAALERLRSASAAEARLQPPRPRRPGGARGPSGQGGQGATLEDPMTGLPVSPLVLFERALVAGLVAAGRDGEAVPRARRLVESVREEADDLVRSYRLASTLAWAAGTGSAAVVDAAIETPADPASKRPIAIYAEALALKSTGMGPRAETLAVEARRAAAGNPRLHLDALGKLARWGCVEWTVSGYEEILADDSVPDGEFVVASVMFGEYLHDLGRDTEAAAVLRRLLEEPGTNRPAPAELLAQNGRDPKATRSRMLFFESCAAEARGDGQARGKLLDTAIEGSEADVDAVIAAYHHAAGDPERRRRALQAIRTALDRIGAEIEAAADDSSGLSNALNEYAWIVANTEGDFERAVRSSKRSLELSFDNASYLDTLAHAHAATGRLDRAIRVQSVAARHEPHNRTIRRNLERFRAAAAKAAGGP